MHDPFEGIAQDGTIKTGARRDRIPPQFVAVVREAVAAVDHHQASLYLYGSVANGTAQPQTSDVDFLSVDLPTASAVATRLSRDFARLCRAWRSDVLGVRIARKTLLSIAGLVSVHNRTWTTSRSVGAQRWTEIEPELGSGLSLLESWADGSDRPTHSDVRRTLTAPGIVAAIVARFNNLIGLWPDTRRTP